MIHSIFYNEVGNASRYPIGFWNNYEHRKLAASICHSKEEYKKTFGGAYNHSRKISNEIENFYDMFFDKKTYPRNYWKSYDHRLKAAKQCKSRAEYAKRFPGACDKTMEIKGEMDFFRENIFTDNPTPPNYWKSYEHRLEAAKQCKSKSEYATKFPVAYRYSKKDIDEFDDFTKRFFTDTFVDDESKIYLIYAYLDNELMLCYCGLTRQTLKARDGQHRRKQDKLYKLFVNEYQTNIPTPIVIKKDLNRIEAQEAEDYYIHYYEKQGYRILNSGHTGVNVGSIGYTFKYNKEQCLSCAKKCTSIKEFRQTYNKEYHSAVHNKWIEEYTWLEPDKYKKDVTYEECKELAKTCKNITEFEKKYPSEVITARKNKWLYDFFNEPVSWTYEVCYNEAKKFKTRTDFRKYCNGAYVASQNNGWLNDFTWLEYKEQRPRTFERFLEDVLKYPTRKEIYKKDSTLYDALFKRKLFECFYDDSGCLKEYIKNMSTNSEEYKKLKEEVERKNKIFLEKDKIKCKKGREKRKALKNC